MAARTFVLGAMLVTVAFVGCTGSDDLQVVDNPTEPCGALEDGFDLEEAEAYAPRVELSTSKGPVRMIVYLEQVPVSAGMFLDRADKGFYEETRFHFLEEDSFIQGGDPISANEEQRQRWGTGGQETQPNEFHQHLRHDQPGIVSVAGQIPNAGGSQFVITLEPLRGLDDQQEVFGRVISGLDAVREISRTPTDDQNRPQNDAKLHEIRILNPPESEENASVSLSSYGFDCVQAAEPGDRAEYLVSVRNSGERLLNGTFSADTPGEDWSVELRNTGAIALPSGQTSQYIVDVQVPDDAANGTHEVPIRFEEPGSEARTERNLTVNVGPLGEPPNRGDTITIDYVGTLQDGRVFDTTRSVYVDEPSLAWFHPRPPHTTSLEVTLGESPMVPGMVTLLERAKTGASVVGSIAPTDGYGTDDWGQTGLGGRLLYFQMHHHAEDVEADPIPGRPGT